MADQIVKIGNSVVQHGPANDRVYLMKLDDSDVSDIVTEIMRLAEQHGYSKLFAKIPAYSGAEFEKHGFVPEAQVPCMYRGSQTGMFMSRFLDEQRAVPDDPERITKVLQVAEQKAGTFVPSDTGDAILRLRLGDAAALAALYAEVFESYPFPVDDPAFIAESMKSDTAFFGIFDDGKLVAAASMEIDMSWLCAEMTDFATLPEYRQRGAAGRLLHHMEDAAVSMGLRTLYTIARAESFGMNVVFSRAGYAFGGTLQNNTQIGGKLESMNVWHKQV